MYKPKFSVIIPSFKMGKYIAEALDSVAAQTCLDWEIVVVDDCAPDDGTADIVSSFARKHPDKRVEFIQHKVNTGVSGARNTAIKAAQGGYLAFLDPDDLWLPNYLEAVEKQFNTELDCDAVSSPPIVFWEASKRPNAKPDLVIIESWKILHFPASLAIGNFLQPSSTVVRKSHVVNVGGFDIDRDMQHIEDYDLWIRLAQAGTRFSFLNQNLTKYRQHPTAATSDTRRMSQLHEFLAQKHSAFFLSSQSQIIRLLMRDRSRKEKNLWNLIRTFLRRILRQ